MIEHTTDTGFRYYSDTPPLIEGTEGIDDGYIEGPDTDVSDLYITTGIISDVVSSELSETTLPDDELAAAEMLPLAELSIESAELASEKIGILNVQAWVHDRMHRYPPHVTADIQGVRFVDIPRHGMPKEEAQTAATSNGRRGIVEVDVASGSLADAHDLLDREVWRNVEEGLSEPELQEWAAICTVERVVTYQNTAGDVVEDVRASESLAHSGEIYMNEPLKLLEQGLGHRFAFLQARFGRYSPDEIEVQLANLANDGHAARNIAQANRTLVRNADKAIERTWRQAT